MSNWIESLEGRTLFAAAPIPTYVAADAAAVVNDQQALKTDVSTTTYTLHSSASALETDVSEIGITKTNLVLGKKVLVAGTKYLAVLNADTRAFNAKLTPVLRNLELAEAAYIAKSTKATQKRLSAADRSAESMGTLASRLDTAAANTAAVDASLTALSDANPSSPALTTDAQHAIDAAGSLATTLNGQVTTTLTDLGTLIDQVERAQ